MHTRYNSTKFCTVDYCMTSSLFHSFSKIQWLWFSFRKNFLLTTHVTWRSTIYGVLIHSNVDLPCVFTQKPTRKIYLATGHWKWSQRHMTHEQVNIRLHNNYQVKVKLLRNWLKHQNFDCFNTDCFGVKVSVLNLNAEGHGFDPILDKTKDIKIGICCFSAKHTAFRSKSKDWLNQSQNNVSGRHVFCFSELAC